MACFIVSWGSANAEDLAHLSSQPEFRKATRNMMLASAALNKALSEVALGPWIEGAGLIYSSSRGELEPTKEFLKIFSQTRTGRPLLFQNSLHSSTLGFLSLRHKIRGPAVALSNGVFGAENSLQTAQTFLDDGICSVCMVVSADSVPNGLESLVQGEGATALLLANKEGLAQIGASATLVLEKVESLPALKSNFSGSYHDVDALERMSAALSASPEQRSLSIEKSNGGHSEIHWSFANEKAR